MPDLIERVRSAPHCAAMSGGHGDPFNGIHLVCERDEGRRWTRIKSGVTTTACQRAVLPVAGAAGAGAGAAAGGPAGVAGAEAGAALR
jgi:hypothetical protein